MAQGAKIKRLNVSTTLVVSQKETLEEKRQLRKP